MGDENINKRTGATIIEYTRSLIEASLDPLVTISPDGKITDVNEATEKVTGRKRNELIGSDFSGYFTQPAKAKEGYEQVFNKGTVRDYPLELRHKNGKTTPVLYNASVYKDKTGNVIGVFAVARDITEIKRIEEALQATSKLLQSIMDSSTEQIILPTDSEGRILAWNEGARRLLGYEPQEIVGKETIHIFHSEDYLKSEKMGSNIENMIKTKEPLVEELFYTNKNGKTFPVRQIVTPRFDGNGKFIGMLGMAHDITKRKKAELEMTEMNKQLKRNVERANQMAVKAEAANMAKSEFLANMSHEIRTPMNGILGFADLLLEEELTQEQREAANTIKKSGESLLNLINDILDLSKVKSSKMELETIPFNVENLILDIGELMNTNLGEKPMEINCNIGDIHTNLLGDPMRLRQVITNLVGNAIKFTYEGEIVIGVTALKEDEEEVTLKFFIKDTGIGIPEDKLETIFESFKQVDGSTTREFGGTGLGLTISKKFAQLMGGNMWVESPVDCQLSIEDCRLNNDKTVSKSQNNHQSSIDNHQSKGGPGSIFYFTARFKKDQESSEPIEPTDIKELEKKPILIVDDNETALKIVANIVKRVGMVPVLARSGEKALDCLKAESLVTDHSSLMKDETNDHFPEIAIIDIMMPGMSGHELARKISKFTDKRIKMIALSSNVFFGSSAKTQDSGFAGFVAKPVRRRLLIDLIRTVSGIKEERPKSIVTKHRVREIMAYDVKILYAEDNPVNQLLGKKMFKRMGYKKVKIAPDGLAALKEVKENSHYDIIFMDLQMPNMGGLEATQEIRKWEGDSSQLTEKNGKPATRNSHPDCGSYR